MIFDIFRPKDGLPTLSSKEKKLIKEATSPTLLAQSEQARTRRLAEAVDNHINNLTPAERQAIIDKRAEDKLERRIATLTQYQDQQQTRQRVIDRNRSALLHPNRNQSQT